MLNFGSVDHFRLRLREWGIEVHTGVAGTGVVGVLKGTGTSTRAVARTIGLRADLDALELVAAEVPRVGRNDPCPCGSGKKYKACHGRLS